MSRMEPPDWKALKIAEDEAKELLLKRKKQLAKQKLEAKVKREMQPHIAFDRGVHSAYESMALGQDECYCSKCYKKKHGDDK